MTEKEIAVAMYEKGYRYIIFTDDPDPMLDPVYAKTLAEIGPLFRALFPGRTIPNVQTIDEYLK